MNKAISFLCLSLLLLACRKDKSLKNFRDDLSIKDVYGTWKLISKENYNTNTVSYKDQQVYNYCSNGGRCDVVLILKHMGATDTIVGHTITNQVFGSFIFDSKQRTFKLKEFGGTQIGEPQWSNNIWDHMYLIESFKISKYYLRLYFDNGNQSLTFEKQ